MNILLTNDDGYYSYGINILKEKLKEIGNVYVFAPLKVQSGKSCSGTFDSPLTVKKIDKTTFAVNGTPSDCVNLGLFYLKEYLNIDIDLVVSGSNAGENISYDTMYSGTIGACLEASKNNLPSIAFSGPADFRFVEDYCLKCVEYINDNNLLSKNHIVSVNFPYSEQIDGIKMSKFYYRQDKHYYVKYNGKFYSRRDVEKDCPKDSDAYLLHSNYIGIIILKNSLSNDN